MIDQVLGDALERLASQAAGNGDAQRTVADLYAAAGCHVDAKRHRTAPTVTGIRDEHLREAERLRREGHEHAQALAAGATDTSVADVAEIWAASEHHRAAARSHEPVDAIGLVRVAVTQLGHVPDLVAAANPPTGAITSIGTTSELLDWFATRCSDRFTAAVAAADDAAGARALNAWVAFHVSCVIDAQFRTGSQFITVPAGILDDLAKLADGAFRLGPQCAHAACDAFNRLVTGERGYVTRQLTAAQTWSAVITRVAADYRGRPTPEWWTPESFPARCAATAMDCCDWQDTSWRPHHRLLPLQLARPRTPRADYTGGFVPVNASTIAALEHAQLASFVVSRQSPSSSGVCVWPPSVSEELRGPLQAPPTPTAVHAVAERLGVGARSVFDHDGSDFGPAPLLPGFGFAPHALPDLDYWDMHAARLGTRVTLVAGTLSAAGTQLLVCLADPVAVDFVHVPGLAVGSIDPDDD